MKSITGMLMLSALVVPASPAAAQGNLQYQIERIADYALTIAADALGELVDERDDRARRDRDGRQRGPGRGRDDRDRGEQFTDTVNKTVRLGRNGRLELESLSGDVEIIGGTGDDVRVTATKSIHSNNESTARRALNATEVQIAERPGLVTISAGPTQGRVSSVEVDYVISVPSGTSVSVDSFSGDISVRNITGDLQVNSKSGDVVVKDAKPRIAEIEIVSGDVSLEQVDSERVQVKSVSGDITLIGRLARNGRYDLGTHSGDIQVVPVGNPGFEIEARTFSGDVSSDFPLKLRPGLTNLRDTGRGPNRNNDIRGTVNDGGAVLSLHSFSGDILINKR
jgi:hypothetical protein